MKRMNDQLDMMNEPFVKKLLDHKNKFYGEPDDYAINLDFAQFRIGVLGLSNHYYGEDFGLYTYKNQIYDSIMTKDEYEGGKMQDKLRLLGILEKFHLRPEPLSPLWRTPDLDKWREFVRTGKDELLEKASAETRAREGMTPEDLPDVTNLSVHPDWDNLSFEKTVDVVTGVITEGFGPGATDKESSEKAWAAQEATQAALRAEIERRSAARPSGDTAVEWSTRTYFEPTWTDSKTREFRERKAKLRIRLADLALPAVVEQRFVQLMGPRIVDGWAAVVADRYHTKAENKLYSLLVMRALLQEAWRAHPRFVHITETRAALLEQQNSAVQARVRERADKDTRMTVFTFLHQ